MACVPCGQRELTPLLFAVDSAQQHADGGIFVWFLYVAVKGFEVEGALRSLGEFFLVGHQEVQKFRLLEHMDPVDGLLNLDCR
jgi:hypothetical protein